MPSIVSLRKKQDITKLAAEYFLSSFVSAHGDIVTDQDIYLDCTFQGSIKTEGLIEIDTNAKIEASIEARAIKLNGIFNGTLTAKEHLTIASGAQASGQLQASVVQIDQGAIINAQIISKLHNN